jgi:probable HAF family extracellular repeat protein
MKTCRGVARLLIVILMVLAANAAAAPKATFKFTTVQIKGAVNTSVFGINNAAVKVGLYDDSQFFEHGFILKDGKVTTLDDQGDYTACVGINNPGDVIGFYFNSRGQQSFLWHDKKFINFPRKYAAAGINDHGQVVGFFSDSNGAAHGFVWDGKKYKQLDVPGAAGTAATGINNNGLIAIEWYDGTNSHGAIYNGKKYSKFSVPGATDTFPQGIDSAGDVVLSWMDSFNVQHGALRAGGKFFKFDAPQAVYGTFPYGINDHKVIVGRYYTTPTDFAGFRASYK